MNKILKITFMFALIIAAPINSPLNAMQDIDGKQKAVLITGTSSGFGKATTELLSSRGHFVYAGVLNSEEAKMWVDNPNVKALVLDVTKPTDIAAVVEVVEAEGRGLYGLVNNAGIAVLGVMIEMPEEEFDLQLNVNLYGPYRIAKAFAPFIIASKGRVTNISSISGILTSPTFGAYAISKHGLEAYSDTLSAEMEKFGVHVSLIEPGTYKTSIGDTMLDRLKERGENFENSAFQEELEGTMRWAGRLGTETGDPIEVVMSIEASLFEDNPKNRYLVAPDEETALITVKRLIRETVELNERHRFSFTEEELIEMIKEILADQ